MDIIKKRIVPTGEIYIVQGEKNKPLECLSLADYGKAQNIKADFLGFTEEINGVTHGELLPLSEKWVITISSQYGCSMDCKFCDVPKVGKGLNATFGDIVGQVKTVMDMHSDIKDGRINLHYARMGEPTFNLDILSANSIIGNMLFEKGFDFHPVISTMMPKNNKMLMGFLSLWLVYKEKHGAGLQLSINTTDEVAREKMFSGNAMKLKDISAMMKMIISAMGVKGRKISLNFALTGDEINAELLRGLFDPQYFLIKITPMHITVSSIENKIGNDDGYYSFVPYKKYEDDLKAVGFDVIVFVPSVEEDNSKITCGNAILSEKF